MMAPFDYERKSRAAWWSGGFWTSCQSQRGRHYSDQLAAVRVGVMGVMLGASIRVDPHLLTVSHLSLLCSLYLTLSPRHRVTDPGGEKPRKRQGSGWHILLDTGIAEIVAK